MGVTSPVSGLILSIALLSELALPRSLTSPILSQGNKGLTFQITTKL